METYDYEEAVTYMKVELKCVVVSSGGQCAMMIGKLKMQILHASSWDFLQKVIIEEGD